jgi:hypothetical protein
MEISFRSPSKASSASFSHQFDNRLARIFRPDDRHPLIGFEDEFKVGDILSSNPEKSRLSVHFPISEYGLLNGESKPKTILFRNLHSEFRNLFSGPAVLDQGSFDIPKKEDVLKRPFYRQELF